METIDLKESHTKLGFTRFETAEITARANVLIANYQIFFHKLQNFHWNVVGGDFFDIHEITEGMYKETLKNIDDIAERIRAFGNTPAYKLSGYLKESAIEEVTHEMSGEYMVREIVSDIEILLSYLIDVHELAASNGDIATKALIERITSSLEKQHWQLSSFVNQKYAS